MAVVYRRKRPPMAVAIGVRNVRCEREVLPTVSRSDADTGLRDGHDDLKFLRQAAFRFERRRSCISSIPIIPFAADAGLLPGCIGCISRMMMVGISGVSVGPDCANAVLPSSDSAASAAEIFFSSSASPCVRVVASPSQAACRQDVGRATVAIAERSEAYGGARRARDNLFIASIRVTAAPSPTATGDAP